MAQGAPSHAWAYRTTPYTTIGKTPFKLSYGTEALMSIEIRISSPRVQNFNEILNDERLRLNLNLLEETRDSTVLHLAAYQQRVVWYFNNQVKSKTFQVGNLVLRQAETSTPQDTEKLMLMREGPYMIVEVLGLGTYKLQSIDGKPVLYTWYAARLRQYYQ